ncbi:hypothetical protein M5D96_002985 [Drosophila gunungcola]|uniref:Uncharacterized protein n=1 Tax=Drosophila gunungcola TaxID=103775 RepID=A0A9Q0BW07_9MUSC|nr:hypothetical protein M5D96_002985 [Drosophila gunungcola]
MLFPCLKMDDMTDGPKHVRGAHSEQHLPASSIQCSVFSVQYPASNIPDPRSSTQGFQGSHEAADHCSVTVRLHQLDFQFQFGMPRSSPCPQILPPPLAASFILDSSCISRPLAARFNCLFDWRSPLQHIEKTQCSNSLF